MVWFNKQCKKCGSQDIEIELSEEDIIKNKAELMLFNKWHKLNDELDEIDIQLYKRSITKDKESELKERKDIIHYEMEEIEKIFYKIKEFNKWKIIKQISQKILIGLLFLIIGGIIFFTLHVLKYCK